MTDVTPPTDPDDALDELASAHLDGMTTPAEAARIDGDPELRARVAAMARVREALAAPPPVDEGAREAAIAAALAAVEAEPSPARDDLAAVRAGRARWRLRYLAVAAAVAVAALAVPLLGRLDDDSRREDMAATAADSSQPVREDTDAGGPESAAGGAAQDGVATLAAGDLGAFPDAGALRSAVRDRLARDDTAFSGGDVAATTTAARACAAELAAPDEPAATFEATATLDDVPVLVVVRPRADGTPVLTVLRAADCLLLVESELR